MNNNKKLTPHIRKRMVELNNEGKTVVEICLLFQISRKTFYKWKNRLQDNNEYLSLSDRKTSPKSHPNRIPKDLERTIIKIRDKKAWSSQKIHIYLSNKNILNPKTNKPVSEKTIRNIFNRYQRGYKFDKLKQKKEKIIRYEKKIPGELVHIDTKKLKNVAGENPKCKKYEAGVIDDATRISYVEILPDKKSKTLANFFKRAYNWFKKKYNIIIKSVLSDNGKEFTWHSETGRKFHSFEVMCLMLNIKHRYTRVRRPQTNGKIERLWRTLNEELFNRYRFFSHKHRNEALMKYLYYYNDSRMHMGIKGLTPVQKLNLCNKMENEKNIIISLSVA
ncbi:MAG: IS481 family transposase [Patescibacteria group bacterium]|nr:IS481 family transposase [Patescibacteria group bacterium]